MNNPATPPKPKFVEFYPAPATSNAKYTAVLYDKHNEYIKSLNFGNRKYQQYADTTPLALYAHLDHRDPKRRANYHSRHRAILNKHGQPAYLDPLQPAYYSYFYLW